MKIYEHQGPMVTLFDQWNSLGINTAFSSIKLFSNSEYRNLARDNHITTFVIFPVFFNAGELASNPELFAITAQGNQAKEEWVEFVCPSRKNYRVQMVENAREVVRKYNPEGISIDFIRHFVFWEKVYPDKDPGALPMTCFDSACLNGFQEETGIRIPRGLTSTSEKASWILTNHGERWMKWRSNLITSMVREIADAVREIKPEILITVHLVPWVNEDFGGAGMRIAGQDVVALSGIADYLSPMTYAHMVKREPRWIHSIVKSIYGQSRGKILPSIQVSKAYLEKNLGVEEFEQSLSEALKPPSSGVVFWSWERLAREPRKLAVLKDILQQN